MAFRHRSGSFRSLLVLLALLAATPAAAMTVHEARCRATLADSFGLAVTKAHRAVTKCHLKRDRGVFPASTDCNDLAVADALTGSNLAEAEVHMDTKVSAHCKDVPAVLAQFARCPSTGSAADDGGATTGIDSFEELSGCLRFHLHEIVERNARATLGSPAVPLERYAHKCHVTIAKTFERLIRVTFRNRTECQLASDEAGGPIDYACATFDDFGDFPYDVARLAEKLTSTCADQAAVVDSCADDAAGIAKCALREAAVTTGGGLVAMAWELPGTCPGAIRLRFDQDIEINDVDTGWSGFNHDAVPVGGYDAAQYSLACDEDCLNCTGSSPTVPPENCRCDGDHSVECGSDADCATAGGDCFCYLAPPTHVNAVAAPYCALTPIGGSMSGAVDLEAGTASLDVLVRQRLGYGRGRTEGICPVCVAGVCDGGARHGLACDVDAIDASFGPTSFDCPPVPGWSLNGGGTPVSLSLAAEPSSLPFALACDAPLASEACACSTCSLDGQIACNSDSDCAALGAGVCRTDGPSFLEVAREPNSCSDHICTADSLHDGKCASDPDDLFCDGAVEASGKGILVCETNSDCEAWDPICTGSDCGTCTLAQPRNCFLDSIEASPPGPFTMVGVGCMPATGKTTLDQIYGLPGPYRIVQAFSLHRPMCSDGVTPYEAPGGSSCP